MEAVTVQALTTVAGLALVTGMVVFIIRSTLALTDDIMKRVGALISVGVAVLLAIVADLVLHLTTGNDLLQAALNGLVAGLAASGGYDVVRGALRGGPSDL